MMVVSFRSFLVAFLAFLALCKVPVIVLLVMVAAVVLAALVKEALHGQLINTNGDNKV